MKHTNPSHHTEHNIHSSPYGTADSGYFTIHKRSQNIPVIHEKTAASPNDMSGDDRGPASRVYHVKPGQPQVIRLGGGRSNVQDLSGYSSDGDVSAAPQVLHMIPRGATVVYGGGGGGASTPAVYSRQVSFGDGPNVHGASSSSKVFQTPGGSMIRISSPAPGDGPANEQPRFVMRRGVSTDDLLSGPSPMAVQTQYSVPVRHEVVPPGGINRQYYGRSRSADRLLDDDEGSLQQRGFSYQQIPVQTSSVHHTLVDSNTSSETPKFYVVPGFQRSGK